MNFKLLRAECRQNPHLGTGLLTLANCGWFIVQQVHHGIRICFRDPILLLMEAVFVQSSGTVFPSLSIWLFVFNLSSGTDKAESSIIPNRPVQQRCKAPGPDMLVILFAIEPTSTPVGAIRMHGEDIGCPHYPVSSNALSLILACCASMNSFQNC